MKMTRSAMAAVAGMTVLLWGCAPAPQASAKRPLTLSDDQVNKASAALKSMPGKVRLVMSNEAPKKLGQQLHDMFGSAETMNVNAATLPPGITVVGEEDDPGVQTVIKAFSAAAIPYNFNPMGYQGPADAHKVPVAITVAEASK